MVRLFSRNTRYRVLAKDGENWVEIGELDEKPSIAVLRAEFPDIDEYDAVRVVDGKGRTVYYYAFKRRRRKNVLSEVEESLQLVKKFRELLSQVEGERGDAFESLVYIAHLGETMRRLAESLPWLKAMICGAQAGGGGDLEELFGFLEKLRLFQAAAARPGPAPQPQAPAPQPEPPREAAEAVERAIEEAAEKISEATPRPCDLLGGEECVTSPDSEPGEE